MQGIFLCEREVSRKKTVSMITFTSPFPYLYVHGPKKGVGVRLEYYKTRNLLWVAICIIVV